MSKVNGAAKKVDTSYAAEFAAGKKEETKFQEKLYQERGIKIIPKTITVYEDTNNNGKADIGEDKNLNGKLDKGEDQKVHGKRNRRLDMIDKPLNQYTIYPYSRDRMVKDPAFVDYMEKNGYTYVCGTLQGDKIEGFVRTVQVAELKIDSKEGSYVGIRSMDAEQTSKVAVKVRQTFDKNGTNGESLGYKPYRGFGIWRGPVDGGEEKVAKKPEKKPAKAEEKPKSKQQVGSDEEVKNDGTIKVGDYKTNPPELKLQNITKDSFDQIAPKRDLSYLNLTSQQSGKSIGVARVYSTENDPNLSIIGPGPNSKEQKFIEERTQQVFRYALSQGYKEIIGPTYIDGVSSYIFIK